MPRHSITKEKPKYPGPFSGPVFLAFLLSPSGPAAVSTAAARSGSYSFCIPNSARIFDKEVELMEYCVKI